MRRQISGLREATPIAEGFFLVQVTRARYYADRHKPFIALQLSVLEPKPVFGRMLSSRLYCTAKALWKLNWFLRDFGYDLELLGRDEIDDHAVAGLRGVVKVSHSMVNGQPYLSLDGFAPASRWGDFQLAQAG